MKLVAILPPLRAERLREGRQSLIRRYLRWAALAIGVMVVGGCGNNPASPSANDLLNAGLKAQFEGNTALASDDYKKVLAMDPHNKFAYYNLGLIDQQAGRVESAERNYRSALQVDPDFPSALFNLAILRTVPSPNEAVDLYRHLISVKPDWAAAHLNLGFLLIHRGQASEGHAELDLAIRLDPTLAQRLPPASPTASPTHKP